MSVRKLSAAETEALLNELGNRDCGQGCKCVFCRTFEEGVQCGKHDALIGIRRALDELKRNLGA